jgi:hypothetical protein
MAVEKAARSVASMVSTMDERKAGRSAAWTVE